MPSNKPEKDKSKRPPQSEGPVTTKIYVLLVDSGRDCRLFHEADLSSLAEIVAPVLGLKTVEALKALQDMVVGTTFSTNLPQSPCFFVTTPEQYVCLLPPPPPSS